MTSGSSIPLKKLLQLFSEKPIDGRPAPDPGDDHLWALAGCHPGARLISGDLLLLDKPPLDFVVIAPRQFLQASS